MLALSTIAAGWSSATKWPSGGERYLVVPLVFKISAGSDEDPEWVRFPFTSAIFSVRNVWECAVPCRDMRGNRSGLMAGRLLSDVGGLQVS